MIVRLLASGLLGAIGVWFVAPGSPGMGAPVLTGRLFPELSTNATILTRGEALILEVKVPAGAGVSVDRAILAGNALFSGDYGPAKPIPGGESVLLAGGTLIRRRLTVPPDWFKLPAKPAALDLPRAELRWESLSLRLVGSTFLFLDEDVASARVELTTSMGRMEFALLPEKAPDHVKNFLHLARKKFYDGTTFHRVIKNCLIQGGDPNTTNDDLKDDGLGRAPWQVKSEFSCLPHVPGTLSMVLLTPDQDSASCQFFIVAGTQERLGYNGKYTIFGRLIKGDNVLADIAGVKTGGPHGTRPEKSVVLRRVRILYPD